MALSTTSSWSAELNEKQDLFELIVTDYVALRKSSEDLTNLKLLWDMISSVIYTFTSWNTTLWDKIDVDYLVEETKKLQKETKQLPKGCAQYDVFRTLGDQVKALLTSLPLVAELRHPAMRERHWKLLQQVTGKKFTMDEKFSLGDLLALELHTCADSVSEIVERAQKELVIEKQLVKIEKDWAGLHLDFVPFNPDSDVVNIVVDDLIVEALENDNLLLQNLGSNKYVQGTKFQEIVDEWQKKLGTVDSVLSVWADVAKKWSMLESVFIGSQDIRVQLPEDSKRFDGVNTEFTNMMRDAPDITNVVEACNVDDRLENLERMLGLLEMCEKALQDYLETKRIAFPRFYFVAPSDLLDILSKGTNPQLILRHLSKCFDNIHNLSFEPDEMGNPSKNAISMWSGEKENVAFAGKCMCEGPVEQWLNVVVETMRAALFHEFKLSVPKYDQMPRTKWMFEQSAQNTITVSRLIFTQEVNEAFDRLEDGDDNAMKDLLQKQLDQLKGIIEAVNGKLEKLDRKKVLTLCTIDVHARDTCQKLIDEKVAGVADAFQWSSQLRYGTNEKTGKLQINVCDAEIPYMYEYIGSPGCLVITPLTDRCVITLTQAQRLVLGGAPRVPRVPARRRR